MPGIGVVERGLGLERYAMNPVFASSMDNGGCASGIRRAFANRGEPFDPAAHDRLESDLSLSGTLSIEFIKWAVQAASEKIL